MPAADDGAPVTGDCRTSGSGWMSVATSPAEHTRPRPPLEAAARWRHHPTSDVPGRVRRALATQLRHWDLRGIDHDDVALVLTELVTNATDVVGPFKGDPGSCGW
jgi:hypothetical protein